MRGKVLHIKKTNTINIRKVTGCLLSGMNKNQITDFMFVMDLNPNGVSFDNASLTVGDRVRVVKGDLSGIEGEIATESNKTYVVIRIKDILTASVKVPKSYLKIIK